jgi:hypothetical protein
VDSRVRIYFSLRFHISPLYSDFYPTFLLDYFCSQSL